jgi:hypothetical protein
MKFQLIVNFKSKSPAIAPSESTGSGDSQRFEIKVELDSTPSINDMSIGFLAIIIAMFIGYNVYGSSGLDNRIDNLSTGLDNRIDNLSSGLNNRIDNLSSGSDNRIENLSSGLNNRIDNLTKITMKGQAVSESQLSRQDKMQFSFEELQSAMARLKTLMEVQQSDTAKLKTAMEEQRFSMAEQRTSIEQIQSAVAKLQDSVDSQPRASGECRERLPGQKDPATGSITEQSPQAHAKPAGSRSAQ